MSWCGTEFRIRLPVESFRLLCHGDTKPTIPECSPRFLVSGGPERDWLTSLVHGGMRNPLLGLSCNEIFHVLFNYYIRPVMCIINESQVTKAPATTIAP